MSLAQWLRQNVQPYQNPNRVYSDIDNALLRFSTLRPKSDVYTFDDGRTQLLLCIHGLLSITFRGVPYNIPMALWIPREYPRLAPISYVVPTNDMFVKPGKYLDVSGRCNIDYIQHWERKYEGCSLSALLEAFQDYFSREPPVYSKPKEVQTPSSPQSSSIDHRYADKPPPPVPSSSPPGIGSSPARPPIPLPTLHSPEPQRPPINLPTLKAPPPPPPLPPQVQGKGILSSSSAGPVQDITSAFTTRRADRSGIQQAFSFREPPLLAPTLPAFSPPRPPPPPPLQVVASYTPPHPRDPPRPEPPRLPAPNLLDDDYSSTPPAASFQSLGESTITAAPPPRPPNPELLRLHDQVHEKMTSELKSLVQALSLDAERLRAHQSDLLAGEPAIKDEMARLEAVRDVCRSVATRTGQAVAQAETNIAELRRKGDPEVDELVCATNIVHNQLINLIADDNAIEDTIYHLHRSLNGGRIDLERFLRSTRVLAEEQFMKRALIEKIQTSMSTVPSSSIAPDWT